MWSMELAEEESVDVIGSVLDADLIGDRSAITPKL